MLFLMRHITEPLKLADRVRLELTSHSHDRQYSKLLHLPTLPPIHLAGVVGFEPTNLYKKIACLVGRCYQPLNQTPINTVFFLIYVKNSKNTFYGVIKILAIMLIFNNQNLLDSFNIIRHFLSSLL